MTQTAVTLITISAFTHAFWNFLGKRRRPSLAFFLLANSTAALVLSPLLFIYRQALAEIPISVWLLVAAAGVFQTTYFVGLAGAYRHGDMSLAYPLARALPGVFVAMLNIVFGKGNQIGVLGIAGMLLVTAGCLILPLTRFGTLHLRDYLTSVSLFALVAAVGTTGYTLIDDEALRQMRSFGEIRISATEVALLYITLEAISIVMISGAYAMSNRMERRTLTELWQTNLGYAGITGIIIIATYCLVLVSMAHVTNVSYVAAFRQFSIPIGAILGMTLQGEPRHQPKLIGIGTVFAGLTMVAFG
jgi:drug/metabolite transporter (DMT)-like permease